MESEVLNCIDVQVDLQEQFDVVVEQSEVNLEPLTITENGVYTPQGIATGFSKVEANVLPKSTDIVITENGEYYPNDYEVDAFSKVDVDVKPKLEDLTATDNGTYTPSESFDGFGKVNVDLINVVKVSNLNVSNDCINSNGIWEGEKIIDTSQCNAISFGGCTKLKSLDTSKWNTQKLTHTRYMFNGCNQLKVLDVSNFITDNITDISYMFQGCRSLEVLDLRNWDLSKVGDVNNTYTTQAFYNCTELKSLIGGITIEEVLANNISCMNNLGRSFGLYTNLKLDRASLRAAINGVADMTGKTTQIFNIGNNIEKLTEEDIAILTNKNWTISA